MRQFRGFADKLPFPSFVKDGTWKYVLAPSDAAAGFVTVEIHNPNADDVVGVRPGSNSQSDAHWKFLLKAGHYTTIHVTTKGYFPGFLQALASHPDTEFHVTAEWGGDAVIYKSFNPITAPGWQGGTEGSPNNSGTYREVNLRTVRYGPPSFPFWLPAEHYGNLEALICMCRPGSQEDCADVRAHGSAWWGESPYPQGVEGYGKNQGIIVKVEDTDIVEVRENGPPAGKLGGNVKDGYVYLLGYILRGSYNDGFGALYEYNAIADPVDDAVGSDAWENLDVTPRTSARVHDVYWRAQYQAAEFGPPADFYVREVGSIDAVLSQGYLNFTNDFPLTTVSGEVQHYFPAIAKSWVFGWLDLMGTRAINPGPADGAVNVSHLTQLEWTAGVNALSHDVYFGTTAVLGAGQFQGNQADVTFNPGQLVQGTTYYWRIDEVGPGGTITGVVWQFTVGLSPCDWFDPDAPGPDWQAGGAGQDWASPASAASWKDDKAAPDWAATTSGDGWFDPQECS